ncbi:MAG: hypothetical protein VX533_02865 [Pseudomonadota bacterium]|nr:hypothetical protein [Pseudomonadota bacterium]
MSGSSGSMGGMSGSSGSMGGSGWPQDPDQVLNESMGDFDGDISRERGVLARSGGGSAKAAGRREQADSGSVKDAGIGQGPGGVAGLPGGESASGGNASTAGGSDGSQSSQAGSGPQVGAEGSQAGGGSGSTSTERSGRDNQGSDRDSANVAKIPDDIPIDGSGDDAVGEQIREMAMAEEDPVLREAIWEEYRKHTGIN